MKKNVSVQIAQNIKKYRLLNNMTQEELAGHLDLDTQYYAQLERGERNFTIEKIIRICTFFHIGIESIIEIQDFPSDDAAQLRQNLTSTLESLTYSQLRLVEKFITEIVPYTK